MNDELLQYLSMLVELDAARHDLCEEYGGGCERTHLQQAAREWIDAHNNYRVCKNCRWEHYHYSDSPCDECNSNTITRSNWQPKVDAQGVE